MDEKSWIHAQSLKRVRWELKEQVITEKEAMVRLHGTMHQNRSRDIIDVKVVKNHLCVQSIIMFPVKMNFFSPLFNPVEINFTLLLTSCFSRLSSLEFK